MIVWPVMMRELNGLSRQLPTYLSRSLGASVLLAVWAVMQFDEQIGRGSVKGPMLFAALHSTLLGAVWLLVPLLAADSISQERREGTLSLLFLTPLKAGGIVVAKSLAQVLRAVTLWLAAVPILTIPFILGGVSWQQVLTSVMFNGGSLILALAGAVFASSCCKSRSNAIAIAFLLSAAMLYAFQGAAGQSLFTAGTQVSYRPGGIVLAPTRLSQQIITLPVSAVAGALLLLAGAVFNVKRAARQEPPSVRVLALKRQFFSPVLFTGTLKRWLNWELYRNPIGWLEERSWASRLVVWSWLAILISVYSWFFSNMTLLMRGFHALQVALGWMLASSIAVTACGSFRRERETGVLELLLVAPINEWRIITGRLRGIWTQFAPSMILLFVVWLYCGSFLASYMTSQPALILFFVCLFATLPIVGLHFSLSTANFMSAFLKTLAIGIAVPEILARLCEYTVELALTPQTPFSTPVLRIPFQLIVAGVLLRSMHRRLRRRNFAFTVDS